MGSQKAFILDGRGHIIRRASWKNTEKGSIGGTNPISKRRRFDIKWN